MARLKKKFLARGRELLVDHKQFYVQTHDGKIVIRPLSVPLLKPSKISFVGDVNLKGIGGVKALRRLLGIKPLTRAELRTRLEKIEAHYHKAGYLIMGENPGRTKGLQLALQGKKDGSLRIIVRVVRMGTVKIGGSIPMKSKAALKKALQMSSGKPFMPKKFMRAIKIALAKLALGLPRAPVFVMRPDGKMDVVVGVQRPQARFDLMAGTDGKYFMGALGGTFHHLIPGFSTFSVSGMAAKDNYGIGVSVKSLPLNAAGVHLSASLKYIYSYYYYRMGTDQIDEFGMHHYGSGSLTVHIPLGSQGIASPFDLYVTTRGSVINRDGQKYDGAKVKGTEYYVGNTVGVSSLHKSVFTKGDTLKADVSIGLDHNVTTRKGDVTLAGSISYKIPLGKYFALEASAQGAVRLPAYGGKLSADRYFGEWNIPLIDFGRSMGDPYSSKHFWHGALFLMLTHNRYFQPMIGATISGDGRGGVKGGAGAALRIPFIGLTLYFGSDHRGRFTWGLSAGGVREL